MSSTPQTQYQAPRYGQHNAGVLALLIRSASFQASKKNRKPTIASDFWLEQAATMESTRPASSAEHNSQLAGLSDSKLHTEFRQIAGMLYKMRRMSSPTHPDYQIFTADPQAQIKLDAVSVFYDQPFQHFSSSALAIATLHPTDLLPFAAPITRVPLSALKIDFVFLLYSGCQRAVWVSQRIQA